MLRGCHIPYYGMVRFFFSTPRGCLQLEGRHRQWIVAGWWYTYPFEQYFTINLDDYSQYMEKYENMFQSSPTRCSFLIASDRFETTSSGAVPQSLGILISACTNAFPVVSAAVFSSLSRIATTSSKVHSEVSRMRRSWLFAKHMARANTSPDPTNPTLTSGIIWVFKHHQSLLVDDPFPYNFP